MRNPVRPPVGFFNRRLSTRQNSSSDKVSKVDTALPLLASTQCDVHFHFYFYIYFHFHFLFCFLFDLASTYTFTFILSYCMNSVLECHFHFLFAFFCFSIYFHFHNQSPRTPNRSASTTDVESHTESDAERGEVIIFCFHSLAQNLHHLHYFFYGKYISRKAILSPLTLATSAIFRHLTKAQILPPLLYLSRRLKILQPKKSQRQLRA